MLTVSFVYYLLLFIQIKIFDSYKSIKFLKT